MLYVVCYTLYAIRRHKIRCKKIVPVICRFLPLSATVRTWSLPHRSTFVGHRSAFPIDNCYISLVKKKFDWKRATMPYRWGRLHVRTVHGGRQREKPAALGLKPASDLCLEAWTTQVASGPRAVGVPRPPRAGRGRGLGGSRYRAVRTSSRYVTPPKSDSYIQ